MTEYEFSFLVEFTIVRSGKSPVEGTDGAGDLVSLRKKITVAQKQDQSE